MKRSIWMAAAVVLATATPLWAGEMMKSDAGSANPAVKGGGPSQPNETQPGMAAGGDAAKGKGMRSNKGSSTSSKAATGAKSDMKGETMGSSSNPGNPATKGGGPSQPNESQPGMGSVKK